MYRSLFLLLCCVSAAYSQLAVTEFLASNVNSITDEDGNHEDWIEVRNVSGGTVNLSGWYLTDDPTQPRRWAFPNWSLNAGGYVVVFASDKNRRPAQAVAGVDNIGSVTQKKLHTNFKLSADGEYLALTKDDANGALVVVQSYEPFPPQATDVSYGAQIATTATTLLGPGTAVKYLVPSATNGGSTLDYAAWTGANEPFAETGWTAGTTTIGFPSAGVAQTNLKLRLNANSSDTTTADTSGAPHNGANTGVSFVASDTDAVGKTRHGTMRFGATDSNGSLTGDLATVTPSADFDASVGTICFWIRTAGLAGQGNEAMVFDRRSGLGVGQGMVIYQGADGKLTMQSGNGGGGVATVFPTSVSVADDRWHHVALVFAQASGAECRFYVDGSLNSQAISGTWSWNSAQQIELGHSHDPSWRAFNGQLDDFRFYNAQLSAAQISQIFGNADEPMTVATNLQTEMLAKNASVFVRVPFEVANPGAFDAINLKIQWADGYAAWLNGTPVGTFATPAPLVYNSAATQTHSFGAPQSVTLSTASGGLRTGTNVLAIQALNNLSTNAYFGVLPQIEGVKIAQGVSGYLTNPTPGGENSAAKTNLGPFVNAVTRDPDPRPTGTAASPPLTITARILASLRPLAANNPVQLQYVVMFGAEVPVTMTDAGPAVGAPPGTRLYTASIPTSGLKPGQMLRWRVVAKDNTDVTTTAPAFADATDGDRYYGTVAVDSTIQSNLPVIYWFAGNPGAAETTTGTRDSFFFKAIGDTGPGRFYDNVGINIHGQSSTGFPKKSYNLDFNRDNRFQWDVTQKEVKDVDLLTNWGDKSKTHNVMTHEAFAAAGSVSHWGRQVRVQQVTANNLTNPGGQFYCISDMLEDGDENFLERNGRDPNGALYKIYDNLADVSGAEKKTRKDEGKTDYQALIDGLDPNKAIETRRLYAYDNMDLPQCVSYFVGCIITSHQDHGHKNYYVYRDTLRTGEWMIFPWDVDLTWGRTYLDNPGYFSDTMYVDNELDQYKQSMQNKGENRLYNLFVGNNDYGRTPAPEFRDMVLRRLRTVMDTYFSVPNLLENRFAELANLMDPPTIGTSDADLELAKWGAWGNTGGATGGAALRFHISEITGPGRYLAGRRSFLNTATLAGASVPASQPANAANLLSIETVDFKPAATQEQEFFVVRNSNSYSVDISGWKITGAVDMVFKPGTVLPPGGGVTDNKGDLYVAKNPAVFRARATVSDDGQPATARYRYVQGPYSGQLSARGETIELRDAAGTLLKTKTWTPAPTPTQSQLRITELNYAPTNPTATELSALAGVVAGDFEFVELQNIGATPLTITGASFTNGISFTFPTRVLAAGERVLVVANVAAFQLRYGHGADAKIAGVFIGNLDNSGENLQLTDVSGETILDFTYSDTWFPPSDKGGRTLVIPAANPAYDSYDLPQSWLMSGTVNGTPGLADSDFATAFEGWRWSYFTAAEMPTDADPNLPAALMLDPDGDGLINLMEYAFGRQPKTFDSGSPLTTAAVLPFGGADYLTVTFTRPHLAVDLQYVVEGCGNLAVGDWQPVGVLESTVDLGNGLERVTFRDSIPCSSQPGRSLRVRVVK